MRFIIVAIAVLLHSSCGKEFTQSPGPAGATGATGSQGEAGINGIDPTPVSMVQLCPGVPTYPSVFIEYAACVQGMLFATYSANGGFTTYLPPGAYSSNAVGSSCSFTVVSGCEVTN